MTFQKKLLFSMALLLLLALSLLSLLAGNLLKREVNQALESEMNNSLRLTHATASQWLAGKASVMEALSQQLPARPSDWQTWESALTLALTAGEFDLVYVGTAHGDMIQSQPPGTLPDGYDPRTRPWYQQGREAGHLIVTPPYVDAVTGDLIISMAVPLQAEPDSIVGSDLLITGIVEQLLTTHTRWRSEVWMLDANQQVLAHADQGLLQRQLKELLPTFELRRAGLQRVQHQGRDWLASSIQVEEAGWTFLLLIEEDQVHAINRSLAWQLGGLSLLVILLSALLLYWLTISLSRPLLQLQQQLKQITLSLDLSQRIRVQDSAEVGDLAQQTNSLLERLAAVIREIVGSSAQLNHSATRLAHTAGLVSHNSQLQQETSHSMAAAVEQMSSSVAEITSTMEELSASSTQIADHSQSVVEVANLTLENSRKGVAAMEQLNTRMTHIYEDNQQSLQEIMDLGAKSKQISKVMDLINTLADQTRLIAFNAALEASSAGESGKRFSVVAGEIRRLADSVTDSTREIEGHIQEIQDSISRLVINSEKGASSIESGRHLSAETAEDLDALFNAASRTSTVAQQISLSTKQQKTASSQVVVALRDIANASAHNADSVRNITEISEEMIEMSRTLSQLVKEFRLPQPATSDPNETSDDETDSGTDR